MGGTIVMAMKRSDGRGHRWPRGGGPPSRGRLQGRGSAVKVRLTDGVVASRNVGLARQLSRRGHLRSAVSLASSQWTGLPRFAAQQSGSCQLRPEKRPHAMTSPLPSDDVTGTVIGRQQSPRALLYGFDDEHDEAEASALDGLFPTTKRIESFSEIQEREYDIVITKGRSLPDGTASHLFVVAVGCAKLGKIEAPQSPQGSDWRMATVGSMGNSKAREFKEPSGLPKRLKRLVYGDLLPLLQERSEDQAMPYLHVHGPFLLQSGSAARAVEAIQPLLVTTEPVVVAGIFQRRGGTAACLALPAGSDIVEWTRAAVEVWSEVAPERFPAPPAWERAERWMTPGERQRVKDLEAVDSEWQEVQAGFAKRRAAAQVELAHATTQANAHQRRLLVAQGDDLVAAVTEALETLGFDVRNMDEVWPENDRREDLRVTACDHPGWNALVEVRGYVRGAKQSDLLRIASRFVPRYMQDEGKAPSSAWYIVNHDVGRDPSQRDRVLAGNEADIMEFANGVAAGLVVDTVTFFEVLMSVEAGAIEAPAARAALIGQKGVFQPPLPD
jgi:hypothetical protein